MNKAKHGYNTAPTDGPPILLTTFIGLLLSLMLADYASDTYQVSLVFMTILYFIPVMMFVWVFWGYINEISNPKYPVSFLTRFFTTILGFSVIWGAFALLNALFHAVIRAIGRG